MGPVILAVFYLFRAKKIEDAVAREGDIIINPAQRGLKAGNIVLNRLRASRVHIVEHRRIKSDELLGLVHGLRAYGYHGAAE